MIEALVPAHCRAQIVRASHRTAFKRERPFGGFQVLGLPWALTCIMVFQRCEAIACRQNSVLTNSIIGELSFDTLAAGFMVMQQVPAAVGAPVVGDDVILRGWGCSDLEAGTRAGPQDVRFEIDSISKLFTWLGAMMLVEEGALDLHADVSGYLRTTVVPGDAPLTLAHLLSHRPGYPPARLA